MKEGCVLNDGIITTLRYKSEGTDIDFKSTQYRFEGGSENDKAEMLKDILAIANSWRDGNGYILLGFKDQRPHPAEVVGISKSIDDAAIQQFVNGKVSPKLTFSYEEHLYGGRTVGVITIPKQKRSFYLSNAYGKLKSNVVYVRRGSSTDEAEPPEIAEMVIADSGRTDVKVDLSVLTSLNSDLPATIARRYLQFTESFPDYESPLPNLDWTGFAIIPSLNKDNRAFWRECAEYIKISESVIHIQFVLHNRSEVQLSNTKLEVSVEPEEGQLVQLFAGNDLPRKPSKKFDPVLEVRTFSEVLAQQNQHLFIDEDGDAPRCFVKFGYLLPGEDGRANDTFSIVSSAPGKLLLRFRILAGELAAPIQIERSIEMTGKVESVDFTGLKSFVNAL